MRTTTILMYALIGLATICHIAFTSPVVRRQILDNPSYIEPAEQDLEEHQEQDRGKRKIEGAVELTYGAKNAILGLVFNHGHKHLLNKHKFFKWPIHGRRRRAVEDVNGESPLARDRREGKRVETTTEDVVMFTPGQKVSLEVPDQLFGSGFTLITNISQVVGSLIQNSAERTARIFETMKPFLQTVFGVRSLTITRDGPSENAV